VSSAFKPPRFALNWIEATAPRHLRESVVGDLEEEFHERAARGRATATLWYIRQAAALALRLGWFDAFHKQPQRDGYLPRKGDGLMESLWNDMRFGARMLSRAPGFTFVAILTLALGIGANAAIFSIVNALLIKPLPLPDSERLMSIGGLDAKGRSQFVSFPDYEDLRKEAKLFEGITAMVPQSANLTGVAEPQRVRGGFVSENFFKVIAIEPAMGRAFNDGDDALSAEPVCVVAYDAWQNLFGADPKILGRSLLLNNTAFTVIGVLPRGFRFPMDDVEVWMPYHLWPPFKTADAYLNRANPLVGPIGKLKPGVSQEQAMAELKTISARLAQQYADAGPGRSFRMRPLRDSIVVNARLMVLTLMGAVAFVLLIACANVANLMLARASARKGEIATRAALGAGRGRLAKQMLTEAALLWAAGGVLGLLLGYAALTALLASSPTPLPGGIVPKLDWTVLAFTFGVSAVTGVLFGAFAALRFSRPDLTSTLKEGGRGGDGPGKARLGNFLVVAQVALTLIMLVGSALMIRSFQKLTKVDVGFKTENLLSLEYRLPANKYPDGAQQWEVHKKIVERVSALPGVVSATVARAVPFGGNGSTATFEIPGTPPPAKGNAPRVLMNFIDTHYFQTMGIPLLRGRTPNDQDGPTTPIVVVINRRLAELYFADQDPIGRTLFFPDTKASITATIIGVVADVKHYDLSDPDRAQAYAFQAQQPHIFNSLIIRTVGEPVAMTNAVRGAVWSVDPEQPMWKIYSMDFMIDRALGQPRFLMRLMGVYSGLALLLAAVGLYGVMAYSVSQRSKEIGVRMALGAQHRDVLNLVLGRGMRLTAMGLVLGLLGSLALGEVVSDLLFGVQSYDPAALSGAAVVLTLVALVASYVPAKRATRGNPVAALHRA